MSLALKFLMPQDPEASSAGNWNKLAFSNDSSGHASAQPKGKSHEGRPARQLPKAIRPPFGFAISDRESNTSELPVNDLLTNSGNSD
jgi:hypothetical protein